MQHGAVTVVYDGDGNRVAKTAGGVTTKYLVDTNSVTGYAQVLEELNNSNAITRKYTYGLQLISENQLIGSTQTAAFYGYDGHGSVRQLTDRNGAVTDTYTYDAFGNILTTTGSTPNNYKFAGEQFDPDLGLYYNRARYLDVRQGRFWGTDTFEGKSKEPISLHKYLFGGADPVDKIDASGNDGDIASLQTVGAAFTTLATTAFVTFQNVAGAIYLNLYRVPQIIEDVNQGLTAALGTFEILRILGTNVVNYAESYSRGPAIRGGQAEIAANVNLDRSFPSIDHFDKNSGVAIQLRTTTQTSSPQALLNVVRKGVNTMSNLPDVLSGYDREGNPVRIVTSEIKGKEFLC